MGADVGSSFLSGKLNQYLLSTIGFAMKIFFSISTSLFLALLTISCTGIDILATDISKSSNPPINLQKSDLAGTWVANYGSYHGVDKLILKEDGRFRQEYENPREGYVFQTPWSSWQLKRFADGRVRIYLEGARYYAGGSKGGDLLAAEDWQFCDPFVKRDDNWSQWSVNMKGRLVLNVRLLASDELVLYPMWPDCGDGVFSDREVFHKQK